jgi:ankyrin repeat protein
VQEILCRDRMLAKTFGPANTTPLISAAMRGHIEVARLILEQDDFGLIEVAKDNGKNALHFAARQRGILELSKHYLRKILSLQDEMTRKVKLPFI